MRKAVSFMSILLLMTILMGCTPKYRLDKFVLQSAEEYAESDLRGYEIVGYEIVKYEGYEYQNEVENFRNYRVTFLTIEGKTFSYNIYIGYNKGADGNSLKESDVTTVKVTYDN